MAQKKAAKRIKSDKALLIPIPDWNHADNSIRQIGNHQAEIERLNIKAQADIDLITATLKADVAPHAEAIRLHTNSLQAYAETHRKEFGKARSRKLNFGSIGWRLSTSISIKKGTLDLIKSVFTGARRKACITIKESVDKNALAKLKDDQLATIQARRVVKDVFFVEPGTTQAADVSEKG